MQTSDGDNQHVQKRQRIAQTIAKRMAKVQGITSVAIIGSVATGRAHADSDIDLAATYRDTFDQESLGVACDEIGRDPNGIAESSDPLVFVTALLVEGVPVGLMLGPESYLMDHAQRVGGESQERYRLAYRSYAAAIVLHDPQSLWPSVIQAVREAGRRLGEWSDAE